MNRRKAIKGLAGIGALAFLPNQHLFASQLDKPLHFVGLGRAGTKAMLQVKAQGLGRHHTAVTSPGRLELPEGVRLLPYLPYGLSSHSEKVRLETCSPDRAKPFRLPEEIAGHFAPDHCYILLTALSGYTGTNMCNSLIPMFLDRKRAFRAICSSPFAFEGTKRAQLAEDTVGQFAHLPQFRHFAYESHRPQLGNRGIKEAFELLDREFLEVWKREFG